MTRSRLLALFLGAVTAAACDQTAVQDITGPLAGSRIKFFHFGVNGPGVNFYAGDTKITAISSTTGIESTTGVAYGGVGVGGYYSALEPGQYTFKGKIAATVDKDLAVANVTGTLVDGKRYSFYLSGFYDTAAKTVDGFIVEDPLPTRFVYDSVYVRFVHAISNANPMTLYATNTTTLAESAVGGEVAYKAAGTFTALPGGVYNLSARYAGATTSAIARTSVSLVAGRVYTIGARGDITVVSTTATNRPFLDNTANR